MNNVHVGARFTRLTVVEDLGMHHATSYSRRLWKAACDCGNTVVVSSSNFARQKSCGCMKAELDADKTRLSARCRTHGHSSGGLSPEYMVWQGMISRCTRPSTDSYPRYGGRGIRVCERWESFALFLEDMGKRPKGTTLDRVDNDGNYEPGNCKWSSIEEQNNNRSTSVFVEIDGVRKTATQWARVAGVSDACMFYRIKQGLTGKALIRPSNRKRVSP